MRRPYSFVIIICCLGLALIRCGAPLSAQPELSPETAPATDSAPEISQAKFAPLCAEVVRCDPQTAAVPDSEKICAQMLVGIAGKFPESLRGLEQCLNNQSCEEKNFAFCVAENVQGVGLAPAENTGAPEDALLATGEDIMAACGQLKSATERGRKSRAQLAQDAGL